MAHACHKTIYITWEIATGESRGDTRDIPGVTLLLKIQLVRDSCLGNVKSLQPLEACPVHQAVLFLPIYLNSV